MLLTLPLGVRVMARPVFAAVCLLALAPRTLALRSRTFSAAEVRIPGKVDIPNRSFFGKAYRHKMINHWDLQYAAEFSLGNQTMQGVLDTGSFDLVTFSRHCERCGEARAYDGNASQDVQWGNRTRTQHYGSGSCTSADAKDKVVIGDAMVPAQDFWVAQDCEMPLLGSASFSAIVGVGPPGRMKKVAAKRKVDHKKLEDQYVADGLALPQALKEAMKQNEEDLVDAETKVDLLDSLGIQTVSACYGREAHAPGWMIWNDTTREGQPGVKKVPIQGELTWGVKMGKVGLVDSAGRETAMSCQDGCGAIVDTGTSLIGVPSIIYQRILETLAPDDGESVDCSQLRSLPRLMFTLGDEQFYLPPSAYMGRAYGTLNSEDVGFMRYNQETSEQRCRLLLMDLGKQSTQFGPMFIIGIPFMRHFYTTFDLGAAPEQRSLFVSTASEQCEPEQESTMQFLREMTPLTVDVSKIRMPHWLKSSEHHEL